MNTITTAVIDLAKSTFSLHGVDAHGKTVLRKMLSSTIPLPKGNCSQVNRPAIGT